MLDINLELKNMLIIDLELELNMLDNCLRTIKQPPVGLYVNNRRYPFTYEENHLMLHPYNIPLDLNNIPDDLETNIVDKKGELIVSSYNLHYNKDSISNKPFLAILSLEFLHTLFDYLQYNNNKYKHLYFINEITEESDYLINGIVKNFTFVEDIVGYYFKGLDQNVLMLVTDMVYKNIIPTLNEYLLMDINAYYTINTTGVDIYIHKYDDIRAIRYMEAYERFRFLSNRDKEFEENI
jgi:hypothetical protein